MARPVIFTISAVWDDEASLWSGHCDDVPAAADAPTLDELLAKISAMTLDLLPDNHPGVFDPACVSCRSRPCAKPDARPPEWRLSSIAPCASFCARAAAPSSGRAKAATKSGTVRSPDETSRCLSTSRAGTQRMRSFARRGCPRRSEGGGRFGSLRRVKAAREALAGFAGCSLDRPCQPRATTSRAHRPMAKLTSDKTLPCWQPCEAVVAPDGACGLPMPLFGCSRSS